MKTDPQNQQKQTEEPAESEAWIRFRDRIRREGLLETQHQDGI